jgi:penicillin amidase
MILDSFQDAISVLESRIGSDRGNWRWGAVNRAVFPHPSGQAALIGGGTHEWGGGRYTVRVGHYTIGSFPPFENDFGAVFRAVVASENGTWDIGAVLPPGESGVTFGPHGTDQMDLWLAGELRDVPFPDWDCEATSSCRLVPD